MSIDSSIVPVMPMTPPDGYLRADWDSSYPQSYTFSDVKANYIANPLDTSKVKSGWDGVVDSLQTYPWLVYDSSYPPTYNISGGILYSPNIGVSYENYVGIENPPDTSTEPSNLKNTKSNIRKIKPDVNSKLKRV